MKTRFTTVDISAIIAELKAKYTGMRVMNVYDVDNKTYLIKLQQPESKGTLLLESGTKLHSTEFEWPKNTMPSGFSMKLRKHIRGRRLESITQLGIDRIVDLQFGSSEAAYHIILELYDRGNIVLTDHEYNIMNILRPRTDESQDVRFAVREKYPIESARPPEGLVTVERLIAILQTGKEGDTLKKLLIPHLVYGPAIIEHCLINTGLSANAKLHKDFHPANDMPLLLKAMEEAETILEAVSQQSSKGYIIQKSEKKPTNEQESDSGELLTYLEFHPMLLKQHENQPFLEFPSFDKAVDEFYSKLEGQKLDMKTLQQEKQALKKLENVKKDHEKRISLLQDEQDIDNTRAQLIEINLTLVDRAILIVNSALANQVDWQDMETIVRDAQAQGDPVASAITGLKLQANHITMSLKDPYDHEEGTKPLKVDIDLALMAYANARKYYDKKRGAAMKEQKTVEASSKALKSAERKTKETLKEVQTAATINKARKIYWFEKLLWFISSENYLVIGGRDSQQNELLVKRYFNASDIYVHADLHGASSVIIKNPYKTPVPPKTLNEAGTMAICNSAAWEAKVVTSAWWVTHSQVSKTAPSGEYLTTGSFMIRGKKNYLPPSYLIYGFGFLFKLDEDFIEHHKGERRVRSAQDDENDDVASVTDSDVTSSLADDTASILSLDNSEEGGSDNEIDVETYKTGDPAEEASQGSEDESPQDSGTPSSKDSVSNIKEELTDLEVKTEAAGSSADLKAEDSSEEESLFPDTSLTLQYNKGGKFTLQKDERTPSFSSQQSRESKQDSDDDSTTQETQRPIRLSAKQRRDLKKKQKQKDTDESHQIAEVKQEDVEEEDVMDAKPKPKPVVETAPLKRRQKAKLKKMKEKYKDQDEEERQLRLEILASAGTQKQEKKGKKKNKQQVAQQQKREQQKSQEQHKSARPRAAKQLPPGRITLSDITVETLHTTEGQVKGEDQDDDEQAEGRGGEEDKNDEEEEASTSTSEEQLLNSLTGQPLADDVLLFAIPVCAPYSVLANYKFKVKLLPGTARRGKAAKTVLYMFQTDKATTPRERDLLKSLKDVDFSRNIPGKVKVSAPNLHKSKGK